MEVKFQAIVKEVKIKALASLDKGFSVLLQGEDTNMGYLVNAPADKTAIITVHWESD